MNINNVQIPGVYLFALSECMNDFGIDQWRWLRGTRFTRIDESFIESSIDYLVFRDLVLRAVRFSNNDALGISIGHRLSLQSHGVLGYALMNCENLLSAIQLVEQYISLRMPLLQLTIRFHNDEFIAQLEEKIPLNEVRVIIIDAVLVTVKAALDQLMPNIKKDLTLTFPYARHKNVPYGGLSECTLLFNEPFASIRIPQEFMQKPIPLANLAAFMEAEKLCAKELKSLTNEKAYKSRVKQKLLENTEHFPSQQVMSSMFNMTSRTFHRRLVLEGTTYRAIVEEVKQSLAMTYLSNSSMTIKEISYFLGYEDDRNFSRAFRRWKGISPSQYRAGLGPEHERQ
jgi:AraC-like DNA-binding protein